MLGSFKICLNLTYQILNLNLNVIRIVIFILINNIQLILIIIEIIGYIILFYTLTEHFVDITILNLIL